MNTKAKHDVIVIGAGHAGCEAALASARRGFSTLIFTLNTDKIGWMPCNPSIGGPAKGQIVSEIDALGGEMGLAADKTHIQMKILNRSRGPAVQCYRSQNDKYEYANYMKATLEKQAKLDIVEDCATEIIIKNNTVKGIKTKSGLIFHSKTIVITSGTFLKAKMHIGLTSSIGGRQGEPSSEGLSKNLLDIGLKLGRLKTGTPPRLDRNTINFTPLDIQPGDNQFISFSFKTPYNEKYKDQLPCYLTETNPKTHKIILNNLDRSPLYTNVIEGIGPRYCPSIEDKIVRFKDKTSHHIFIEPESRSTNEIYPQGLNTSLPADTQLELLRSMKGLEKVEILKKGYAVEYDFVYPEQLLPSLETKAINGLFLAGQINGTSGYEEAAGQGIIAGINASLYCEKEPPFHLTRENSFIGTMIDDLITKPIKEPYRMMTSRSEYRLYLRQDNAIFRLGEKGYELGLLSETQIQLIRQQNNQIKTYIKQWKKTTICEGTKQKLCLPEKISYYQLLKRPHIDPKTLPLFESMSVEDYLVAQKAITEIKYEGYLKKQQQEIEKVQKIEKQPIPEHINYLRLTGLKTESREKLHQYRPKTLYEAKRIAGVNPADIMILVSYLKHV